MAGRPIKTRADRVAEYLSRGYALPEIAAMLAISRGQAARAFSNIRRALGPQAR